ncbi:outer membrane beta-barrel protein [Chitinophaga sancti]|uniref:outer membrane beta-barrel protein n=1 Tax=Chitinophaga sancti TaxID=1004 RepID=UPI003F7A897F
MFTTLVLIGMFFQQDTAVHQLKEIAVKAAKPVIKQRAGLVIYDIQADPENKSVDVLHLLRKVPYLSVDADDHLLLKGQADFRVLINGKPSGMDFTTLLKTMPASTIARVEVYTVPPARFDAEGAGGVINIITVARLRDEYKGNVRFSGKWPQGGPGAGASFTLKKRRTGFSAFLGANYTRNPETTQLISGSVVNQEVREHAQERSGYIGLEGSYELDSLNLVTARLNIHRNRLDGDRWLAGVGDSHNRSLNNAMDAGADYQLSGRRHKTRLLTFSFRHSRTEGELYNGLRTNEVLADENTAQVDYVYPLPAVTIEGGIKGIFRDSRSDDFDYQQQVVAAYNSYQFSIRTWDFQAGLRWEHTITARTSYHNFFPDLSVSKTFKNQHQFNAGFSQRMKRPGINRLNPFVDRQNPYFIFTGNPDLMPVVVNSISAGYNIGGRMAGLDYTWLQHADMPVSTYDSTTMVTTSTFANAGNIAGLSAYVYAGFTLASHLTLNTNGNVIYFRIGESELLTYALNIAAAYNFEKGWRVTVDGTVLSKNPTGFQGTTNGLLATAFAVSKEMLKGQLTLNAGVNNPFTKYRHRLVHTSGNGFYQLSDTRLYYRSFTMSMNYNFGKMTGNIKKSKTTINNIDLSNGKGM